jgi:hypothetical protein
MKSRLRYFIITLIAAAATAVSIALAVAGPAAALAGTNWDN